MGTNYYLRLKKKYEPKDEDYSRYYVTLVGELDNGFVWNSHFYAHKDELNRDYFLELHIGKSSCGWHFSLCIYPELGINSLQDWEALFSSKKNVIVDEYGTVITKTEMLDIITKRDRKERNNYASQELYEQDYIKKCNDLYSHVENFPPYADYEEFLKDNHAKRGLNGLLAHNSSQYESTVTGGTYDLTKDWRFS